MLDEECPKCGAKFPADRAWANRSLVMAALSPGLQQLDTRVRCPRCAYVFESVEFRFFGFVRPRAMRIGLGIFALVMVVGVIYFLFFDAP
jgi:DNA-directed RNA polymerase subunit RPC12/RpoP